MALVKLVATKLSHPLFLKQLATPQRNAPPAVTQLSSTLLAFTAASATFPCKQRMGKSPQKVYWRRTGTVKPSAERNQLAKPSLVDLISDRSCSVAVTIGVAHVITGLCAC